MPDNTGVALQGFIIGYTEHIQNTLIKGEITSL